MALPAMTDTIFALASGSARAAIAVMRLSGPSSRPSACARRLCGGMPARRPATPPCAACAIASGALLDHALVLWFPGPSTYTGEDCAELHLHGGRAVIDGVADALTRRACAPPNRGSSPAAPS